MSGTPADRDSRAEALARSHDMEPVHGSVDLDMSADVMWSTFAQPSAWPRWNQCFFWCANRTLRSSIRSAWRLTEPPR
jgi:hypothetical protein